MLILPLDHSEPYFATLGVMLYPAVDDADPPKARAYVAQVLARAFRRFREAGGSPPYDVLAPVLMDAGADFQSFLAEAEILRQWGQTWQQRRATSEPPLPSEVWRVPGNWEPPTRRPG